MNRTGAGRKRDPFKYWLCGRTDKPWANEYGLEDLPPLDPIMEMPPLDPVVEMRRAEADLKRYFGLR